MSDAQVTELLTPRVEVMLNYPDSPFKVGQVLDREYVQIDAGKQFKVCYVDGALLHYVTEEVANACPEVFRNLAWWEQRTPEQMPQYVRCEPTKEVIKVEPWHLFAISNNDYTPITQSEYEQYKK